jgi:cobalt-zinc-cadmium efflux system protein
MGVLVNSFAAYFTHKKGSLNEKAVNLHMLEDVLGWIIVLLGSVIMRFTDTHVIDPLMSVGIAVFISVNAILNLKKILSVFLEKAPQGLDSSKVKKVLKNTSGVIDIHHIHLWSIDGCNTLATMHVVTDTPDLEIKKRIRAALTELGISHVTVELESESEHCYEAECHVHHIEKSYHMHSH